MTLITHKALFSLCHSSETIETWKPCSRALESVRKEYVMRGLLINFLQSVRWLESLTFWPQLQLSNLYIYFLILCTFSSHSCFSAYSYLPSWYTASKIAGLLLIWLWWLSPSTFSSDYGQHTRRVSFNYLHCLTADCTRCVVLSPTKVKLLVLQLTRLFSFCASTQPSKWIGSEPKMQQRATAQNNPFLFSFFKWEKGKRTARPTDVNWQSDWKAINPDVELIIQLHSACGW